MAGKKLESVWLAERDDGLDWHVGTYLTREEATQFAKRFSTLPGGEHKWVATKFVRALPRQGSGK